MLLLGLPPPNHKKLDTDKGVDVDKRREKMSKTPTYRNKALVTAWTGNTSSSI